MTSYTATFADGQVKTLKNSKRSYAAAWQARVTRADGTVCVLSGFARDAAMAHKSAASEAGRVDSIWDSRTRRWVRQNRPTAIEVVAVAVA